MELSKKALTSVSAIVLTGALVAPAYAQSATDQANGQAATTAATDSQQTPSATGKPLEMQSREGFWGHMNPFARKKWVHRQIDPVKDRVNELDEVQAKNSNDIKDVDARATAGINRANQSAAMADQHALDASNRANTANGTATTASNRASSLNGTVQNLDQYQTVVAKSLPFLAGHTVLTKKQKSDLDEMAASLANEKGYIIEVQGYSRAGVNTSQAMADSVVRYLVAEHQVPIYRIYRTGLGNSKYVNEETGRAMTNGVHVAVLHNSLADMQDGGAATQSSTTSSTSRTSSLQ